MLQRAFTGIILRYAKKYIRGIQADLKLSLWGGDVVLDSLELRLEELEQTFHLPSQFSITKGSIKQLRIHIPWTALTTQPVEVTLSVVKLTVSSGEKVHTTNTKRSSASLSDTETLNSTAFDGSTPDKSVTTTRPTPSRQLSDDSTDVGEGWATALLTRILANISITINELVLRYEDHNDFSAPWAFGWAGRNLDPPEPSCICPCVLISVS